MFTRAVIGMRPFAYTNTRRFAFCSAASIGIGATMATQSGYLDGSQGFPVFSGNESKDSPNNFMASGIDLGPFSGIFSHQISPVVFAIIAANVAVFAAWKIPKFQPFLLRHFTSSPRALREGRLHTLITSGFSHMSPGHLMFNMLGLYTISDPVIQILGTNDFIAYYFSALVASEIFSAATLSALFMITRRAHFMTRPCLGASGALFAVFGMSAMMFPDNEFIILFLPWYPLTASTLLPVAVTFDSVGLVYAAFKWSPLGHAAHLGGVLFSVAMLQYYLHYSPRESGAARRMKRLVRYQQDHDVVPWPPVY